MLLIFRRRLHVLVQTEVHVIVHHLKDRPKDVFAHDEHCGLTTRQRFAARQLGGPEDISDFFGNSELSLLRASPIAPPPARQFWASSGPWLPRLGPGFGKTCAGSINRRPRTCAERASAGPREMVGALGGLSGKTSTLVNAWRTTSTIAARRFRSCRQMQPSSTCTTTG